jgi:cation transporter-like permease
MEVAIFEFIIIVLIGVSASMLDSVLRSEKEKNDLREIIVVTIILVLFLTAIFYLISVGNNYG